MKVQEVILRAMAKKITWWQAAEIIGISDRQMRRWRERYEEFGYDGLFDRRRGRPSPKRVPLATVEKILGLYREKYFDLNVQHFHEKLREREQIDLSYTWVKLALQGAGLVARGHRRGVHRQRRERRPLPGMLLHIDGSRHRWFQDDRWYDLLVLLDDATSEIYYAQLVEEESTVTVMAALREVIERKGVFCALYSDRGSHFWLTPKAGGKVDPHRLTQVGRALRQLGVQMIPAYSPQALRAQLWHLAGTAAAGAAPARNPDRGGGQPFSARRVHRRVQPPLSSVGGATWQCLCRLPAQPGSGPDLLPPVRAHSEPGQHGQPAKPGFADRARALAGDPGGLLGDRASASGRKFQYHPRAASGGAIRPPGCGDHTSKNGGATGGGKDGGCAALENAARFPLSHGLGGCSRLTGTGHFTC
jgi:transposase